jgi:hypothetical protein
VRPREVRPPVMQGHPARPTRRQRSQQRLHGRGAWQQWRVRCRGNSSKGRERTRTPGGGRPVARRSLIRETWRFRAPGSVPSTPRPIRRPQTRSAYAPDAPLHPRPPASAPSPPSARRAASAGPVLLRAPAAPRPPRLPRGSVARACPGASRRGFGCKATDAPRRGGARVRRFGCKATDAPRRGGARVRTRLQLGGAQHRVGPPRAEPVRHAESLHGRRQRLAAHDRARPRGGCVSVRARRRTVLVCAPPAELLPKIPAPDARGGA